MNKTWQLNDALDFFQKSFIDLIYQAQSIHRQHFNQNHVQMSTLLSIKTGNCPEDCAYCPQSVRYDTKLAPAKLLPQEQVLAKAKEAKQAGSTRFCMGAAWRKPRDKDLHEVCELVKSVKDLGMETCATLGMLTSDQAEKLHSAGLDYYNHNIDTSPEYYQEIISTRVFQDRLDTLEAARAAGLKLCCGGILGMGETREDRIKMLVLLANMSPAPESVPINKLIPIPGTPLANTVAIDNFEFIRTIALARILMPTSTIRLSAGREHMSPEMQTLCFFAGANSIFAGDTLLTAKNPELHADQELFASLGLQA